MTVEELTAKLLKAEQEIESLCFLVTSLQIENKELRAENRRLREGDEPVVVPSHGNPFACGD